MIRPIGGDVRRVGEGPIGGQLALFQAVDLLEYGVVSQADVNVVRSLWDAVERGDAEAVLALYDPDVVWDVSRGPLGGLTGSGVYHGHAGLSKFFRSWRQALDDAHYELDELMDAGDHVITVGRQRGRGRASGIPLEGADQSAVWTVRNEKIAHVVWYPSREAALKAVGRPG